MLNLAETAPGEPPHPGPTQLFLAFARVGMIGFGGVMPWARRMLVEERRWLSPDEFVNLLSLCQFLPGGNVLNLSICVGARYAGLRGAFAAFAGLLLMPIAIVLMLVSLYAAYSHLPAVESAVRGVSSAAAGLIVAMGIQIGWPYRRDPRTVLVAALVVVTVAVVQVPLYWIIGLVIPASILLAWRWRR